MKSKDLVNWELVSYCYDILADVDALNLNNGKNAYGSGYMGKAAFAIIIIVL